jgi:hypothetical protein
VPDPDDANEPLFVLDGADDPVFVDAIAPETVKLAEQWTAVPAGIGEAAQSAENEVEDVFPGRAG